MDAKKTDRTILEAKVSLDNMLRRFIVTEEILDNYEKTYKYVDSDIRKLRFAQDSNGTLSDAFILYAVAMLGVSDRKAIQLFLAAMKEKNKELNIFDVTDEDGYRRRLRRLMENGFIFRHEYTRTVTNPYKNEPSKHSTSIYTIDKDALTFMNQKLGTNVKVVDWICAKPIEELIGWAASSYVLSKIAQSSTFDKFKPGIFRSKTMGVVYLPCELKFFLKDRNQECYVSSIPAFFHHNVSRQTEDMYLESLLYKINMIKNYFHVRSLQKKIPFMIITCENSEDMKKMMELIINTKALLEYLPHIYLTGEGLIDKNVPLKDCFLQIQKEKTGYELKGSVPVFLE